MKKFYMENTLVQELMINREVVQKSGNWNSFSKVLNSEDKGHNNKGTIGKLNPKMESLKPYF